MHMNIALIISISVLVLSVVIALLWRKRTKVQPAATNTEPEYDEAGYAVAINYSTSFIKTYAGTTYMFLNVTIFNKMAVDMEDVTVITHPDIPIITDLKYKATAEKWEVDKKDAVFSDSLLDRVLFIPAGNTISGYLVTETPRAMCNIETITVAYNRMRFTARVAKEKVLMKTVNFRRY